MRVINPNRVLVKWVPEVKSLLESFEIYDVVIDLSRCIHPDYLSSSRMSQNRIDIEYSFLSPEEQDYSPDVQDATRTVISLLVDESSNIEEWLVSPRSMPGVRVPVRGMGIFSGAFRVTLRKLISVQEKYVTDRYGMSFADPYGTDYHNYRESLLRGRRRRLLRR